MTKLDILNLAAVALPTILAVVGIVVSIEEIKTKSKLAKAVWWGGLLIFGVCTSAIVGWQQSESGKQAKHDAAEATAPLNSKLDALSAQLRALAASVLRGAPSAPVIKVPSVKPAKDKPLPLVGAPERPHERAAEVPPTSAATSVPTASPVAGISFVQRDVVSTNPTEPYETQVIIQTTQTINNASFGIAANGEIDDGRFFVTGQGVMMNVGFGVTSNKRGFVFRFGYPAFSPDSPIVVTLHAKAPFRVTNVIDLRGQE
jgi:hypothetical protein